MRRRLLELFILAGAVTTACAPRGSAVPSANPGEQPAPTPSATAPTVTAPTVTAPSVAGASPASATSAASTPEGGAAPSAQQDRQKPEPQGVFPPLAVAPPHAATAKDGDGTWKPFEGRSDIVVTTLHPHPRSRWQTVHLAALDLSRLELHHMLGVSDVQETKFKHLAEDVGLVPSSEQARLVAMFNGGFQPRHGWWGIKSGDIKLVPPRDEGCMIALFSQEEGVKSGSTVELGEFSQFSERLEQLTSYRQTPPCLLTGGVVDQRLVDGNEKPWGGQAKDRKTRRRSAVGQSADKRTLFYALAEEAGPHALAEALRAAGASAAAQLDINWNWTRFFVFDGEEPPRPVNSLVEKMAKDRGEYVIRRSQRDFFYVLSRP